MKQKSNFYDRSLIILIISQIFGTFGGAFQPVRFVIILFFPMVLFTIKNDRNFLLNHSRKLMFFLFWIIYSVVSIVWVSSTQNALKEIVYNIIDFSILPMFLIFCQRANNPLISIIKAWSFLFTISIPFGLYEYMTDFHLENSHNSGDGNIYIGDGSVRKYMALNFGNLNGYNQILVYCIPFVFSKVILKAYFKKKLQSTFLILMLIIFIILNSSRAALVCLLITIIIFIFQKNSVMSSKLKLAIVFLLFGIAILGYDLIFTNIFSRFTGKQSVSLNESYRKQLFLRGFDVLRGTMFLGTGAGNMKQGYSEYTNFGTSKEFIGSHNFFLEIYVQYGIGIFILFFMFLRNIYKKANSNPVSNFIIKTTMFFYIFANIINSTYLLNPSTWLFIFSVQMFTVFKINKIEF